MPTPTYLLALPAVDATTSDPAQVDALYAQRRDAWTDFKNLAMRDVRKNTDVDERAVLRHPDNLLNWMLALISLRAFVDERIAESRLQLAAAKPLPDADGRSEYLAAKREHDDKHARRVHFAATIEERRTECRYLMRKHGMDRQTDPVELLATLARLRTLLAAGDREGALSLVDSTLAHVAAAERIPDDQGNTRMTDSARDNPTMDNSVEPLPGDAKEHQVSYTAVPDGASVSARTASGIDRSADGDPR